MKKTIRRHILASAAAALLLLACAGCGRGEKVSAPADASLQKVLDAGRLVLGLDASFPPMGFTGADGSIVGFDIDVAQEVCDRLGVELVKKPIDWDEKEKLLNGGEIDCIWNGMSVTKARAEAMNLSDPYMKNEMVFVVSGGSEAKTTGDLAGKTVGVQSGSTAQELLEASELYRDLKVELLEDNLSLLGALERGEIDAGFLDSVVAYYCISSSDGDFFVLAGNLGEEEYAVGFRKGDQALRDRVQEIIYEMNADGKLGEIARRWFGSDITSLR